MYCSLFCFGIYAEVLHRPKTDEKPVLVEFLCVPLISYHALDNVSFLFGSIKSSITIKLVLLQ